MKEECDICHQGLAKDPMGQVIRVDGRTKHGPWADMCEECFQLYGVGLGLGKGQRYVGDRKVDW